MELITRSEQETIDLGYKIGKLLEDNSLIALNGDLASGKTVFTKGIGKALGIKEVINSPTFTILKIYEGDMTLYHIDAYRLYENPYDLGFEEFLDAGGVMVIEWFDYIKDSIDAEYLKVDMSYVDETTRKITIEAQGRKYEDIIKEIEGC